MEYINKPFNCRTCGQQHVECPNCHVMVRVGNFCECCQTKLVTICDCWILRKPYNCGRNKCPAISELMIEIAKEENH